MIRRTELLPGVFLTAVQDERRKTGCFSINFLRPLRREEAAANALLPGMLLRGCERCPDATAFAGALEDLYGADIGCIIRKKGEVQMTGLYAGFLEDRFAKEPIFAPMTELVGEILLHPALENGHFRNEWFLAEKRKLLSVMKNRAGNKRTYVSACMLDVMCENEPYAVLRLGTQPELEALDAEGLTSHYRRILAESRVEMFYLGAQKPETAAEVIRRALRDLPRGEKLCPVHTTVIPAASGVRIAEKRMPMKQARMSMGFRTGCTAEDPGFPALLVLNGIFGANVNGKLCVRLRQELGLCYYVQSTLDKYKGLMIVYCGAENDRLETVRTEVLLQLEVCREGKITDQEMETARHSLLSDLKVMMDSIDRLEDYLIGQTLLNDGTPEELAEAIRNVTKAQVREAARRITLDTVFSLREVEK